MAFINRAFLFTCVILNIQSALTSDDAKISSWNVTKLNTVLISVLVRNKEHVLPYFLTYLERLEYPKSRTSLMFQSDHNTDRSIEVLEKWLKVNKQLYHSVILYLENESAPISGEEGVAHWPNERYTHIISLKERSLASARLIWADYIWALDADVFVTNPHTLSRLIDKRLPVSAPMMRSDGLYSNFWCGMTDKFYYMRTEEYSQILTWKKKGCHSVPMIHSAVLIDLRLLASDNLTYSPSKLSGYTGPHDDIITFARSANMTDLEMFVCNDDIYGYVMVPLEKDDLLSYDLLQLRNLKMEVLVDNGPLEASLLLQEYIQEPEDGEIPVDKIYMINLERRPDRRKRMLQSFAELHLSVNLVKAVDGQPALLWACVAMGHGRADGRQSSPPTHSTG